MQSGDDALQAGTDERIASNSSSLPVSCSGASLPALIVRPPSPPTASSSNGAKQRQGDQAYASSLDSTVALAQSSLDHSLATSTTSSPSADPAWDHRSSASHVAPYRASEPFASALSQRGHFHPYAAESASNASLLWRRLSVQRGAAADAEATARLAQLSQRRQSEPVAAGLPSDILALQDPTRLYHAPSSSLNYLSNATLTGPSATVQHSSPSSYPQLTGTQHHPTFTSLYTSSASGLPRPAATSSSLVNGYSHSSFYTDAIASSSQATMLPGNAATPSASSSNGYKCPNCGKTFARDDLLRRHLAREARAAAQPSLDRQKSCFECARSKARCDLEVPSCGRCRARGKACVYGARSGNPNVRKTSGRSDQGVNVGGPGVHPGQWNVSDPLGGGGPQQWQNAGMMLETNAPGGQGQGQGHHPGYHFPSKSDGTVSEDYESDDSRAWSESYQQHAYQHRHDRNLSSSSNNTSNSLNYQADVQNSSQQAPQFPLHGNVYVPPTYTSLAGSQAREPAMIDTSVQRQRPEDDEVTPVVNPAGAMGPPLVTPSRAREAAAANPAGSAWLGDSMRPPMSASSTRPQVPRLLTGARMPRPPEAGQASARPLFSAQLDLSGWLEEPVIPSPLYRMGPSLSALGAASHSFVLPTPTLLSHQHGAAHLLSNAGAAPMMHNDTIMHQRPEHHQTGSGSDAGPSFSQHAQVAARNWWAAGPQERSAVDAQEVAQACAGHFTLYPALMVLPDPTSPVPPLFHRPWLAFTRQQTPAALALVRVAMAAYHVRLPTSEAMIWDMIRAQAKTIVASYDTLAQSDDMQVFSSTAALWFLVILLLMSTDPGSGQGVDEGLTDSCLVGLSHLARLLLQRVLAREHALSSASTEANGERITPPGPSFFDWGFLETMRRTLFACYALFVLQRFRATSAELQSRLAGAELVLDIRLPATASEFEAGDELEWRAAQHVKITDDQDSALGNALTLRDLLQARSAAQQEWQERVARKKSLSSSPSIAASSTKASPATVAEQGDGAESFLSADDGAKRGIRSPDTIHPNGGGGSDEHEIVSPVTEERKKQMLAYFDRHDDFTNVCLTVTFALDARI